RSLGDRETGGGLSLPIWINFMEHALKGVAVTEPSAPEGVVNVGGEWFYEEYARGAGVGSLGMAAPAGAEQPAAAATAEDISPKRPAAAPPTDERRSILDLFRN
ncbi:MAG TPA: penicillin-binding protein, partial [Ramlibacter sp.]|nr:penicillin-binding protein [Ramlibacter sp.]